MNKLTPPTNPERNGDRFPPWPDQDSCYWLARHTRTQISYACWLDRGHRRNLKTMLPMEATKNDASSLRDIALGTHIARLGGAA